MKIQHQVLLNKPSIIADALPPIYFHENAKPVKVSYSQAQSWVFKEQRNVTDSARYRNIHRLSNSSKPRDSKPRDSKPRDSKPGSEAASSRTRLSLIQTSSGHSARDKKEGVLQYLDSLAQPVYAREGEAKVEAFYQAKARIAIGEFDYRFKTSWTWSFLLQYSLRGTRDVTQAKYLKPKVVNKPVEILLVTEFLY
jgi:hypothetical protein